MLINYNVVPIVIGCYISWLITLSIDISTKPSDIWVITNLSNWGATLYEIVGVPDFKRNKQVDRETVFFSGILEFGGGKYHIWTVLQILNGL